MDDNSAIVTWSMIADFGGAAFISLSIDSMSTVCVSRFTAKRGWATSCFL